jgi:hypothetical protein
VGEGAKRTRGGADDGSDTGRNETAGVRKKLVRLPKLSRPFVGDHAACLVLARTGGDDVAVREGFEPSVEV